MIGCSSLPHTIALSSFKLVLYCFKLVWHPYNSTVYSIPFFTSGTLFDPIVFQAGNAYLHGVYPTAF